MMNFVYIEVTGPTNEDLEYADMILEESATLKELESKLRPNMKVVEVQ